ncbi:NAD-P-binding protein [Trametes gibbosa]|nr:NAD-P-binding protein [Trametes gibbosa]
MESDKSALPLVLLVGATGATGSSIAQGLLDSHNFRVVALVRPASASKPATHALRAAGADIRLGDITDSLDTLKAHLAGVDILISAVVAWSITDQKDLFRAAKEAGVRRVVPCDFGTPGQRGVRELHDQKLDIREFLQTLGVPHTFIDIGWWMQLALPLPTRSAVPAFVKDLMTYTLHTLHGFAADGPSAHKSLLTDRQHIGAFVARIVADPRTLNRAVIAWEDEMTELDAHELGERLSGEEAVLKAKRRFLSQDDLLKMVAEAKAETAKAPNDHMAHAKQSFSEYMNSIHILGENTLANAKRLGYLDARELYPDLPTHTLADFAKVYYTLDEPGREYLGI